MNSALLLAIAAPAAGAVTRGLAATTQSVGSAFTSVLSAVGGKDLEGTAAEPRDTPAKPTLNQSLHTFATQLRSWLGERGAPNSYTINYRLEADGESTVDVTGDAAEQVKQLLASHPNWLAKLRQIATSLQSQSATLNGDGLASPADIQISDVDDRMW